MTKGNIEQFAAMLKADEGLRAQLEAAVREHGDDADARRAFDATVGAISAEVGLPITYDDALAAYEESQSGMELSDDMLEAVAGGVGFYQAMVGAALGFTLFFSAAPTLALAEPEQGGSNAAIEYVQDMAQGEDAIVADDQAITSLETTDQAEEQAYANQEATEQAAISQEVTDMAAAQAKAEQAATFKYSSLIPANNEENLSGKQVTFNGYKWYIIADNSKGANEGTVTLLAANLDFGKCQFSKSERINDYNSSVVKAYLNKMVAGTAGKGKPDFSGVASAMRDTEYGKLYLLSDQEALSLTRPTRYANDWWWLRSPGVCQWATYAMSVHGDSFVDREGSDPERLEFSVRPALQLDLSAVNFDAGSKTFTLR